jgi:hypothetical protein
MKDKQPSRLRRWLKRGAFTLAVLITLLAAVVVFENWRGHRAWQTYRAEQEAKGEVFDWRKLLPSPVPDEQNFAQTPLLAKLTDYTYDSQRGEAVFADPEGKARLENLFAWNRLIKGEGSWRKATRMDWPKVQEWLRAATNSELPAVQALLARPAGNPVDDVLFLLAQNQAELNEITAAVRRPYADFRVHYDEGLLALLPHLAVLKQFTYAFRLRAQAELEAGRTDAALQDWQTCIALNETLKADPVLIGLLVRLAIVESSLQVVWEGLAGRRWSEAQLQAIEARLAEINLVAVALEALRGERAFNMMALDQMHRPEAAGFPKSGTSEVPHFRSMPSGWVSQNKLNIARMYERYIFGALDPDRRQVDIPLIHQYEREVETALSRNGPYTLMARMLFPAIGKSGLKVASAQMAINLARVAVALERHRLAHGSHPEALNALVPAYLESIPLDLDRQPIRYQLQPDGSFILYSIGVDLKDDNGRIGKPNGIFTTEEGDWVWKYPEAADR